MKRSRCKGSFSVDLSTLEDAEKGPVLGPAGFQGAGLITRLSSSEKPCLHRDAYLGGYEMPHLEKTPRDKAKGVFPRRD